MGKKMKLNQNDIKDVEVIGKTEDGTDVSLIKTKGGFNLIVKNTPEMKVIGRGGHQGIARFQANQNEKGIQWSESLFKSENKHAASNPENHYIMASWHSKMLKKSEDAYYQIYHMSKAEDHFIASGMSGKEATRSVQDHGEDDSDLPETPPFDTDALLSKFQQKKK